MLVCYTKGLHYSLGPQQCKNERRCKRKQASSKLSLSYQRLYITVLVSWVVFPPLIKFLNVMRIGQGQEG